MGLHETASREQWSRQLAELLRREKEHTRMGDELARLRRELPWVKLEKQYTLQTKDGPKTLLELFRGRTQLIVYHFMFGPDYEAGCPTCSSTADSFDGVLPHLEARGVTLVCVSRAPIDRLLAYRERMRWNFDWASSYESDFNTDYGTSVIDQAAVPGADGPGLVSNEISLLKLLGEQPTIRHQLPLVTYQNAAASGTDLEGYFSEGHGVSTFARDEDTVYHCYSSYARGTEFLMGYYAILDHAPHGRGEGDQPMHWLRRRDEYMGGPA